MSICTKYLGIICNKYNNTKVYIQVYEYMYKYLSNYSISIFNFFITLLFSSNDELVFLITIRYIFLVNY